jgi:hypothetical protein
MAYARGDRGTSAEIGGNGFRGNGLLHGQGRTSNAAALAVAAESLWLDEVRRGHPIREIARRAGLGCRRVQLGVARARLREEASRIREDLFPGDARAKTERPIAYPGWAVSEDRLPELVPLFPLTPFTPQSTCPHHGPMRPGSIFCCMVCSRSGMDGHPALKRDPRTDPRPDPKVKPAPVLSEKALTKRETRKERRRRERETRQAAPAVATPSERKHPASSPAPFSASSRTP